MSAAAEASADTTPLGRRIAARIAAEGPMPVSEYMALCLLDPEHGYYTTREPFGAGGDFVTAPEVSQMFGELCGTWLVAAWQALGSPPDASVVEIGPGRGTLAADMVRALRILAPVLAERLHLVEASQRLRERQRERLAAAHAAATHHDDVDTLPGGPLLIVANELFDALPTRQFVASNGRWIERCVVLSGDGLAFGLGAGALDEPCNEPDGTIREAAPAREALMSRIADRIKAEGGALLALDYGHSGGTGDTLQAVARHGFVDPLAGPGEADLTSHVDFAALRAVALARGAHVAGPITQGDFLLGMGLLERAGTLGAGLGDAEQEAIADDVERLAGPDAMGTLFKAIAVSGRPLDLPPFALAP